MFPIFIHLVITSQMWILQHMLQGGEEKQSQEHDFVLTSKFI